MSVTLLIESDLSPIPSSVDDIIYIKFKNYNSNTLLDLSIFTNVSHVTINGCCNFDISVFKQLPYYIKNNALMYLCLNHINDKTFALRSKHIRIKNSSNIIIHNDYDADFITCICLINSNVSLTNIMDSGGLIFRMFNSSISNIEK